jgi:ABC-type sugar transport system substrate-binding protein
VWCRSRRLLGIHRGRGAAPAFKWLIGRVGLVGLIAALVADCGDDGRQSFPESRQRDVGAVIKGLDNPFFATMRDGLVRAARRNKLRIEVDAALGLQDTAGQASALESLAAQHDACYIVNPIDETNLIESLATVTPGTPIVNIDSPVDERAAKAEGVAISTYIGTDNVAAGRNFDRERARLAAARLLTGQGAVDGFFAVNDEMALGVGAAVRASGRRGAVAVIGVDGIREALAAVKHGVLSATVAQYPYTIGQLGVEACLAAVRGKALPATVDAPVQLVTERNVARALATLPLPVKHFDDPLTRLVNG